MYGWILASFESTILNQFGVEKWQEIQAMAECTVKTGEFIKNVHYPDDLMVSILNCSEKVLGETKEKLMEHLGENFLKFILENGYDSTIRAQGKTFGEFLENLNEPHRLLRSRFPDSYLPEFWCTKAERQDAGWSCILHYYSQRGTLFYPMVVGLVKKIGHELYDVRVELELHSQFPEETYTHTIWMVRYTEEKKQKLTRTSSGNFAGQNHVLKCPFTGTTFSCRREVRDSPVNHHGSIGLSSSRVCDLFPFHIIVNSSLEVIQYGKKLKSFLRMDPFKQELLTVDELFAFQLPANLSWSWETILSLQDSSVGLFALNRKGNVILRGNIMILDPSVDPGVTEPCAMFLISPVIYNLEEMEALEMKLSDFPAHSCQRDLMMLGEHVKVEQSAAVRLDVLSKKLDEEAKKSMASLKTKRAFVRYVSHEIRSPLNIATLGLRYVSDQVRDCPHISNKPIIEETLLEVKNSCAVAVDILNDLLLYEKFDDGIFSLARTEMKIADYFVEAVSVYKVQARASAITFDIHTRNVDDVIVHIDVTKFSQVLRNLLSNALKFTPKGGKVDVSCYTIPLDHQEKEPIHFAKVPAGVKEQFETLLQLREFKATTKSLEALPSMDDLGFVRICVKDSGAGISEENQKLMFNQFIQFNADVLQNGQGSGLGLWIASSIMHLHGGKIGVFSKGEGKGTSFIVDIPIHHREVKIARSLSTACLGKHKHKLDLDLIAEKLKKLRVLLVDDSAMNRKIVKRVIDGKFDTIEEAENGLEAMKMCSLACREERPYHLILMDSHMPVMNGLDATKSIKGILDNIRIVGVTGNALKHEIDSFLAAGADKVMVKPLNLEELYRYLSDISFGGPSFDDEPLYLSSGSMDQF